MVVALRQRFESIRRSELDRLASTLPVETRERVDDITRLLVEKLLSTPTEQLKSAHDPETIGAYSEALTRLFNLEPKSTQDTQDEVDPAERRDRRVEPFVRAGKR